MRIDKHSFREVWLVDFEFSAPPGERPRPLCLVAREFFSKRTLKLWEDDFVNQKVPPYDIGPEALFVAYYASAELGCHLQLGWAMPENVLDLFVEFRNATNGRKVPCGWSLLGALAYYGLDAIEAAEKESMRELALRGGPYTDSEKSDLLDYCESDVLALDRLLDKMSASMDLPRALLRSSYMKAAACIEHNGVPIDVTALDALRRYWPDIQDELIARIDQDYGVFEERTFKADRWEQWLAKNGKSWPRLESGKLDLKDSTFRQMAAADPAISPMRELRVALSQMRLADLAVGKDGRNRCLLSAFSARTGRNQPSNSKFIFGPAVWLRGLIRPASGTGLAYIDWEQQEFGIAAALSGDSAMQDAYSSGDPYLAFAKQAEAVPRDATKQSHSRERELYKQAVLAVQYGMGHTSLANRIGEPTAVARDLLRKHRETYPTFWKWSDSAVNYAMFNGSLHTVFGWTVHIHGESNPRFLQNFPMQANGSEMLRRACYLATSRGIQVCAPVHDALLIEAPLDTLDDAVQATQQAMAEASSLILGGFELRTDPKVYRYPERYADPRGEKMWNTVWKIVHELVPQKEGHGLPKPTEEEPKKGGQR